MGEFKSLLEDAEKLISYDADDQEARCLLYGCVTLCVPAAFPLKQRNFADLKRTECIQWFQSRWHWHPYRSICSPPLGDCAIYSDGPLLYVSESLHEENDTLRMILAPVPFPTDLRACQNGRSPRRVLQPPVPRVKREWARGVRRRRTSGSAWRSRS